MNEPSSSSRSSPRSRLADRLDALLGTGTGPPSPQDSPRSSLDSPSDLRRRPPPDLAAPHPAPILRWISSWSPGHSRSLSASNSRPSSPSTSSADLTLLREALQEPLIARPPMARLPPPFRPRNLIRPPPFLDNLTRSTLPTASLSPPLAVAHSQNDDSTITQIQPPPIILSHSPSQRTSIDTLRRMSLPPSQSMSMTSVASAAESPVSTVPSSFLPSLSNAAAFSWWSSEPPNDTDALLSEDDRNQRHRKKYNATKNPVVFCHGLLGFDSVTIGPAIAPLQVTHWRGIKEVLEQNGNEVLVTRVPATSSYVDRAQVLEERISQVYPGRSVHLIGHSMGGLDCRYMTTHLTHRKFRVLSVTTIATPHRGSSFADHFLKTIGRERMPSIMSLLDMLPNGGGDGKAFECLTIENMKLFNEETPDVEGVKYFSWGAVYEPGLIDTWKWPHSVILEKEGPNDGLVSVESSKWGTYLGTLSQVNHLDLVGWINTARYKWAEIMGKEIKFRPATFYMGIVDMLAKEVEGQKDEVDEEMQESTGKDTVETDIEGLGAESPSEEMAIKGKEKQETKEREQMIHSLEDAEGKADSSIEGPSCPYVSLRPPTSLASQTESKTSSGSITPRAGFLSGSRSVADSSGTATPRPANRTDEQITPDEGVKKSGA